MVDRCYFYQRFYASMGINSGPVFVTGRYCVKIAKKMELFFLHRG